MKIASTASIESRILKELLFTYLPPEKVIKLLTATTEDDENSKKVQSDGCNPERPCLDINQSVRYTKMRVGNEGLPESDVEAEQSTERMKISGEYVVIKKRD